MVWMYLDKTYQSENRKKTTFQLIIINCNVVGIGFFSKLRVNYFLQVLKCTYCWSLAEVRDFKLFANIQAYFKLPLFFFQNEIIPSSRQQLVWQLILALCDLDYSAADGANCTSATLETIISFPGANSHISLRVYDSVELFYKMLECDWFSDDIIFNVIL